MRFNPMTFDEFERACRAGLERAAHASVSVFRYLPADLLTPVSAFLRLRSTGGFSFLLESVEGGEQLARYSFIGTQPSKVIRAFGPHTFVETTDGGIRPSVAESGDIFDVLADVLEGANVVEDASLPPFTSGAVGFMGYDVVRLIERLPGIPPDDREIPDAIWGVFDSVVAFDHARQVIVLMRRVTVDSDSAIRARYADAMSALDEIAALLSRTEFDIPESVSIVEHSMSRTLDQGGFVAAVETAKEHIRRGDIFQVVLSQRLDLPFSGDSFNLYRALRQTNPSPYLFYLEVDGVGIIGSSPESLVRVNGRRVSTVPIAGTRRRGASDAEDDRLAAELETDPKELAEHVMLVDLGRNDIGRVSTAGSVSVDDFRSVVRYSHVMHLVSLVTGELSDDLSAVDALRACFPAGTVSGAPKVRAMEIIDALEPVKRGPYAGAVGYLDFSGNMDVCIAIRTIVSLRETLYMQAGAGIVADSDPASEWDETENKLGALLAATRLAAGRFVTA